MSKFIKLIKPIIKKKITLFSFILLGIVMSLTILVQTYYQTVHNAFYGEIANNMNFATFTVGKEYNNKVSYQKFITNMRFELENIEHVNGVFQSNTRFNGVTVKEFAKNKKINGSFKIFAANNKTLPKILKGTNFPDLDGYYMVCSKNFVPSDHSAEEFNRFEMLDLTKYLNKNLKLTFPNYDTGEEKEIKVKLVGISKNSSTLYDENNCYVTEKVLKNIFQNQYNEFGELEDVSFYIQLDNYINKDLVFEKLQKLEYQNMMPTTEIAYDYYDQMISNIESITIIVNLIIFIFIAIIMFKQYYDFQNYYNLLHKLGYKNSIICLINLITSILLVLLA